MMYRSSGRFWIVRVSSTRRMRSLEASSAAVNVSSSAVLVYTLEAASVGAVSRFSHAVSNSAGPGWPSVAPLTDAEYGLSTAAVPVPKRARTRHRKLSPSLKPESANAGCAGVMVRCGCHTPTTVPAVGVGRAGRRAFDLVVGGTGHRIPLERGEADVLSHGQARHLIWLLRRRPRRKQQQRGP